MIPFPTRPLLEVADILRAHGEAYTAHRPVTALQAAVMRRLAACRTAALGGHVDACGRCGYTRVSYNSCRDRHCPKCQGAKRAASAGGPAGASAARRALPCGVYLAGGLAPLVLHHPRRLYDLLFPAASQTLLTLAADPKRLGAQIGLTAILHTWGQNLLFHPHLQSLRSLFWGARKAQPTGTESGRIDRRAGSSSARAEPNGSQAQKLAVGGGDKISLNDAEFFAGRRRCPVPNKQEPQ
jgi:Transposase zinc-binding domain